MFGGNGEMGMKDLPPSPSPFQYNCGENGEMGMGRGPPIPIPISIWGWKSSPSLPISPFFPKKNSPNGDGDAGNWGPGEKCASLPYSSYKATTLVNNFLQRNYFMQISNQWPGKISYYITLSSNYFCKSLLRFEWFQWLIYSNKKVKLDGNILCI